MKKMLFTTFIVMLFIAQKTNAVPAYPYPVQYPLPDGTVITIILKGDEWVNWATSSDGYSLLLNKNGFYEYAVKEATEDLVLSGVRFHDEKDRTPAEVSFLKKVQKDLRYSDKQKTNRIQKLRKTEQSTLKKNVSTNQAPKAVTGNVRAPLILVGFQGKSFTKPKEEFEPLMNQIGYTAGGTITGSLRDYFTASSYEQMDFQVDIFGPYTLSHDISYYDFNSGGDPGLMVREAIIAASADGCDFSKYDINDDGIVDAVHVIFAGYGQEAGVPAGQAIWSHKSNVYPPVTLNGKLIYPYSCSPELRGNNGSNITYIGAIAHELSHVFGLPDLYDTDSEENGTSVDVGPWDIMASGTWNDSGRTPALHSAWSRDFMGWTPATELSSPADITLPHPETQGVTYKLNTTTPGEYFLVENRQKTGWDSYIPASGMLIYHVDENNSGWSSNCINCVASRRGLYVKQAGIGSSISGRSNDPYPSKNNTSFTDTSNPDSKSWAGANTNKPITEITQNTTDGTISFLFKGGSSGNLKEVNATPARLNEGTVTGDGLYVAGTTVTLSAAPSINYRFAQWKSGNTIVSTDNPFSFTLTKDTVLTAHFKTANTVETLYAEDFENDVTGWIFANGTQTNQWVTGTSAAATNSRRSAYISNDDGESNQYDTGVASIVHLYKDIELPLTENHYQLSFDWKGYGEVFNNMYMQDYLEVRILSTDTVPVGGIGINTVPLRTFNNSNVWQHTFILLPDSCTGTTIRLIFTWKNDASDGNQPPIAIDNIEIAAITPFLSDVSVNLTKAGTLKDSILNAYFVTKLTVSGKIDARDIRFIRDNMFVLKELDLSRAAIVDYTGTEGTLTNYSITYPANELPQGSFYNKSSLVSTILPVNLTSIDRSAFELCTGLKSVTLPKNINSISRYAFQYCTGLQEIYNLKPAPIEIEDRVFGNMDKSNCQLIVLVNSCEAYTQANVWKNFIIRCEYEPSSDATLSQLTVNEGTLTPDFNSDVAQYRVSVKNSVENITIDAVTAHMYAVATESRIYTLNVGDNIFYVNVTAENGTTEKTYTVTVNREKLSGIEDVDSRAIVYPNPTTGMVYIKNTAGKTPEVTVYNVMGKILLHAKENQIDLSTFPEGMYLLRTEDRIIKIIKN
ncbi:MAG: M6 family metalloprotease domain-containing protein [Dysgonamonadaceae bacterium]|jgi:M6 family metalloprotease-like protein|nr:M6 family metalloprotease domain-containing protein [Dysgonamonadaceae bacterium]